MPFGFWEAGKPEDGRPWSSSDGLPDQFQRGDKSGGFRSGVVSLRAIRKKIRRSWSLLPALHRAKPRGAIAGLGRTKSRGYCFHFRRYPEGRAIQVAALSEISENGELVSRSSLAKRAALRSFRTGT